MTLFRCIHTPCQSDFVATSQMCSQLSSFGIQADILTTFLPMIYGKNTFLSLGFESMYTFVALKSWQGLQASSWMIRDKCGPVDCTIGLTPQKSQFSDQLLTANVNMNEPKQDQIRTVQLKQQTQRTVNYLSGFCFKLLSFRMACYKYTRTC